MAHGVNLLLGGLASFVVFFMLISFLFHLDQTSLVDKYDSYGFTTRMSDDLFFSECEMYTKQGVWVGCVKMRIAAREIFEPYREDE